jgi:DNA modification methylase
VVLDPFNGSGTTGQVALQHGRRYVGIELNPEYFELTRDRLELVIKARALAATPSPQSDLFAA